MARLYADEQYPLPVVQLLRSLGHDILTIQEVGKAEVGTPDEEVLAFATSKNRAVLTLNKRDYIKLHHIQPSHAGIVVCTNDRNWERAANRINEAIITQEPLRGKLIRVNLPSP